ncbi:hypothetical protein JL100_004855 [Skermanella mucosa]|uniref:hypothetical protein n=1 Tax=Skermanella mucosa TaxID=1789672 RepID=UPI00192C7F7F|nr:hypothetical protein [Skermanella mucosa]UEM22091.1 hypothetical protein JL100_004855 [Skermanella mucosa]
MTDDQPPSKPPGVPGPTRQERQAAALRENLRKRKEQARERRQSGVPAAPDPASPGREEDGDP